MTDEPVGRRFLRWNLGALALAAVLALVGGQLPASTSEERSRFSDPLWDDGQAEVARYDASRVVYGEPRTYELVTIAVKELHDPATRTKPAEPRRGSLDAVKLVRIEDVPSGRAYRYRQTLVVRVARHEPARLLDASCGSQEWCGNSYVQVSGGGLHAHSYFEGEGDRDLSLPPGTWLEDQLVAWARGVDLAPGTRRELRLLPTLVSNHHPRAPVAATVTVEPDETVASPAGSFPCAHVRVKRADDATLDLWVARASPHVLVKAEASDGRKQLLRSVERTVYWKD